MPRKSNGRQGSRCGWSFKVDLSQDSQEPPDFTLHTTLNSKPRVHFYTISTAIGIAFLSDFHLYHFNELVNQASVFLIDHIKMGGLLLLLALSVRAPRIIHCRAYHES